MHPKEKRVVAWMAFRTRSFRLGITEGSEALSRFSIEATKSLELVGMDISQIEVRIGLQPSKHVLRSLLSQNTLSSREFSELLCVSAVFRLDRDKFDPESADELQDDRLVDAFGCLYLSDAIGALLTLTELSDPGRIECLAGIALCGRAHRPIEAKRAIVDLWFPDPETPTWPPLDTIPLGDVVQWSRKTSFLSRSLATTRVERLLASYTNLIHLSTTRDGESLFRAMQGLEAFYCDGTGDLRKQLGEKSAIWLGPWNETKNIVGHLYDMRSKFIHGSSKLQYWKDHTDPWEEDRKHMDEFSYNVSLATRLVVATLQKCVKDKILDINWSYSFKTLAPPDN